MAEDWKLWPKAFQSLGACSWRLTRRWCAFSTPTARLDAEQRHGTAWPSTRHVDARSGHTQNWWVQDLGPVWLSSRVESEGGGPQKRPCSLRLIAKGQSQDGTSCFAHEGRVGVARAMGIDFGMCGGPVLWRGHCSGCVVVLGPTVTLQKHTM